MTTRRDVLVVLTASAIIAPLVGSAQAPTSRRRIAVIAAVSLARQPLASLVESLRELGYVEGRNIEFDPPVQNAEFAAFAQMAARAVERKPDIIVSYGATATVATRNATKSIPIVMVIGSDPVQLGLVKSLGRPDGNLTGIALELQALAGKRIELIKEVIPSMHRLAVLWNSAGAAQATNMRLVEQEAKRAGVSVLGVEVRSRADFEAAALALSKLKADAMLIVPSSFFNGLGDRILQLEASLKLPTMHGGPSAVRAGGLMSYTPDLNEDFHRAAVYVDKILKGARPSELPIEQPTKFNLVVNLKTARALGLKIPQSILIRANEVIE